MSKSHRRAPQRASADRRRAGRRPRQRGKNSGPMVAVMRDLKSR